MKIKTEQNEIFEAALARPQRKEPTMSDESVYPSVTLRALGEILDSDEPAPETANIIFEGENTDDCDSALEDVIDALTDNRRTSDVEVVRMIGFGASLAFYASVHPIVGHKLTSATREQLVSYAAIINNKGLAFAEAISGYFNNPTEAMSEQYQGEYPSIVAWAEEYHENAGTFDGVPDVLKQYFDMQAWTRDAELGGDITVIKLENPNTYTVHIFYSV